MRFNIITTPDNRKYTISHISIKCSIWPGSNSAWAQRSCPPYLATWLKDIELGEIERFAV